LNLRPSGYEPDELPDCSTPQQTRNYGDPVEFLQPSLLPSPFKGKVGVGMGLGRTA